LAKKEREAAAETERQLARAHAMQSTDVDGGGGSGGNGKRKRQRDNDGDADAAAEVVVADDVASCDDVDDALIEQLLCTMSQLWNTLDRVNAIASGKSRSGNALLSASEFTGGPGGGGAVVHESIAAAFQVGFNHLFSLLSIITFLAFVTKHSLFISLFLRFLLYQERFNQHSTHSLFPLYLLRSFLPYLTLPGRCAWRVFGSLSDRHGPRRRVIDGIAAAGALHAWIAQVGGASALVTFICVLFCVCSLGSASAL
jgi:hypothetical protein